MSSGPSSMSNTAIPPETTKLTIVSQMIFRRPTNPSSLPPLPSLPNLRALHLDHASNHLSAAGWATIAQCMQLEELEIAWAGTELAEFVAPPPALKHLRLKWVSYCDHPPAQSLFDALGSTGRLESLEVSGYCNLPPEALAALAGCPLTRLILCGSRDDGDALRTPHDAALPALRALAPRLRHFELTGTDLSKKEAAALNSLLPRGCKCVMPPKKDFERLFEFSQRCEDARRAGMELPGRLSPVYDKYGYSSWGTYSRRHDYSRATSHREEHGITGLEPFDHSAPNFEDEWW